MAQVALRNIVKTFDKTPAVQGINLDIVDREFIARRIVPSRQRPTPPLFLLWSQRRPTWISVGLVSPLLIICCEKQQKQRRLSWANALRHIVNASEQRVWRSSPGASRRHDRSTMRDRRSS